MKWPSHGANPHKIMEQVPTSLNERWLDFSVNTNPYGSPKELLPFLQERLEMIHDYPDPDYERVHEHIARFHHIDPSQAIVGNGASELIDLLARVWSGKRIGIIEPTFSEYEKTCVANGASVYPILLNEEEQFVLHKGVYSKRIDELDALFLCHPNNPTGNVYEQQAIEDLVVTCKEKGVWLVIDEAFYDFVWDKPFYSPSIAEDSNVIVLRSLTKMFNIPGLRIGYAVGDEGIIQQMRAYQPTWSVNQLAAEAGLFCLNETSFQQESAQSIHIEKQRLFTNLIDCGYEPLHTDTNYFLMEDPFHEDTERMITFLLQQGMIVRHTYNFSSLRGRFVRIAIKKPEENQQLIGALKRWRTLCLPS